MIDQGRMVFADTMEAFNNYIAPHSLVARMVAPPAEEVLRAIPGVTGVTFLTENLIRVFFDGDQEITERFINTCVHQGWRLLELSLDKNSLDEIFAQLSNQSPKATTV